MRCRKIKLTGRKANKPVKSPLSTRQRCTYNNLPNSYDIFFDRFVCENNSFLPQLRRLNFTKKTNFQPSTCCDFASADIYVTFILPYTQNSSVLSVGLSIEPGFPTLAE
jgi:hypothetical protein